MPKRKLTKPSETVLEAIKQAQQRGTPISEAEAGRLRRSAAPRGIPKLPVGAVVRSGKKGEPRYWAPDQRKGPGMLESPLSRRLREMERDFLATLEKLHRRPPVVAASQARSARTKRGLIEQALSELGLSNRQAPARIAKKLNVSAAYVRQIRKKMQLTEGTQ